MLRSRLRLEGPPPGPALTARALANFQPCHRRVLRRPPARHELWVEGVPRRGRPRAPPLRGAPPLHPGARALPRLPHRRAPRQPPASGARTLTLRRRALRTRLPRPPDRLLHRSLPAPAAAPVRRLRPDSRSDRNHHARLPDRPEGARPRDRGAPAADARRAPRRDRDAVLLARPDQRDDHEPPRRTGTGTRARRVARRRNPLLRRRLGDAA